MIRNPVTKRALLLSGLAALAAAPMPAGAAEFVVGASYTINFNGIVEGVVAPGLTATQALTLSNITTALNGNQLFNFTYSLSNTTPDPLVSRISGFGFSSMPDFIGVYTGSGDLFDVVASAATSNNFNGNLNQLSFDAEACFKASGSTNNCNGGGGEGLWDGASTNGSFTLVYGPNTNYSSVNLENFFVRYQSLEGFAGGSGIGQGTSIIRKPPPEITTPVPEPATWALMIVGFGAVGASLRRARRMNFVTA